eukprot:scaffold2269_cov221-Pinguiococcus_pyrenoidosus.AAC.16
MQGESLQSTFGAPRPCGSGVGGVGGVGGVRGVLYKCCGAGRVLARAVATLREVLQLDQCRTRTRGFGRRGPEDLARGALAGAPVRHIPLLVGR